MHSLRTWPARPGYGALCRSCALLLRQYSQAAAEATIEPKIAHRLYAAVVLSRPPQITRDLHPFEKAFFLYQRRLNERLALPFQRYLYFKKESPALIDFQRKIKERKTPARDIGSYDAYSNDRWHDEAHVGTVVSEPENQMEELLKDEENTFKGEKIEIEVEDAVKEEEKAELRPRPRVTDADRTGDVKSLNRMLQRTLYLLVLGKDGRWGFPMAPLLGKENLKIAAARILEQTAGVNMNTWMIGNHPIGHAKMPYSEELVKVNEAGHMEKGDMIFFMKGRIMAGQADITQNVLGVKDFSWLAREEMQPLVGPECWKAIERMLPER